MAIRVIEFLPNTLSRKESNAATDTIENDQHGFGFWAAELKP
jgi:hypothetical protein